MIDQLRDLLAKLVTIGRLPGWHVLYLRLMSPSKRKMLETLGQELGDSHRRFIIQVKNLGDRSSVCSTWLSVHHFDLLAGGQVFIMDALQTMLFLCRHDYDQVANIFDRYVTDEASFRGLILGWVKIPFALQSEGYLNQETGELLPHVTEADRAVMGVICANVWAREMMEACPGRWEYDTLLTELKAYWN